MQLAGWVTFETGTQVTAGITPTPDAVQEEGPTATVVVEYEDGPYTVAAVYRPLVEP